MITVSKTHARRNLSSLIKEVENGTVVTIMERGRPRVALVSVAEASKLTRRPPDTRNLGDFLVNYQSSDEMTSRSSLIEFDD